MISVLAPLLALVLAVPASADITAQDKQFIAALKSAGWTITDSNTLIDHAHLICNEGLAHGATWQEMRATLMEWGFSRLDSSTLISKAVSVYCPAYDDVIAELANEVASVGTDSQDDLFVLHLKRVTGITAEKSAAVDMADTACRSPLAGVGLYNATQRMHQRYPEYNLNTIGLIMAQGVLVYCPDRLR